MANWNIEGDYYVDGISGNDGNIGSADSPFKTINAAATQAETGETIVVGTGTYNEQLHLGSVVNYKFIADGIVLLDSTGLNQNTVIYSCRDNTFTGFRFINGATFGGQGATYRNKYYSCIFTDLDALAQTTQGSYNPNTASGWISYVLEYHDCEFHNCNLAANVWVKNIRFLGCKFINSPILVTEEGIGINDNSWAVWYERCFFGRSDEFQDLVLLYFRAYSNDESVLSDCFFEEGGLIRHNFNDNTPGLTDQPLHNTPIKEFLQLHQNSNSASHIINDNHLVGQGDYNTNTSGFKNFSGLEGSLKSGNNTEIFENYLLSPLLKHYPTTAFGCEDDPNNPLHTSGGATWTNIKKENNSLTINSTSTNNGIGIIESAIVDLGQTKPITRIRSSWYSTSFNECSISADPLGPDNQLPFQPTFEMKFGEELEGDGTLSGAYEKFCFDKPLFKDSNDYGNGDVNYNTDEEEVIEARYLQFKITLRSDITA